MKNTLIRYEWHHKIPRSLGGTDDPSNLIRIPIEEHFMDHLNTAISLGEDPSGETHWFAAALIYKRMYGYEIDRVRGHISDKNFDTMMRYVLKLERGETDSNYTMRKKAKINDILDDMFPSYSESSDTRLVEMPNYGGEKTRYRTQKNWNGKRYSYSNW